VSEARRGFVFDLGACMCQNIKCPGRGSRYGGARARESLERGGDSLKGASGPRARRNLTQRGGQPSSEAEPYSRGRSALERGGVSLVRCRTPRAKRSFARGWLGLTVLVGCWGRQDRGPLLLICDCFRRVLSLCVRLCFVICGRKCVFSGYSGDLYGCPRHPVRRPP
jgi:hypothetical protein